MLELMKVIKRQSDELGKLLNQSYEAQLFSGLETAQNKEAGDSVGEFPSSNSNNDSVVSIYDAINKCDCRVV